MSSFIQASPQIPLAGELASLGAALVWAGSMTLYALDARTVPARTLNLFKNSVALLCLLVVTMASGVKAPESLETMGYLALSGLVGIALGDTAFFAALKRLGAQVTSSVQCLAPPISALIAAFALGEVLTPFEQVGLFVTVMAVAGIVYFGQREGAVLFALPRQTLLVGLALAGGSALCQALGIVIARQALQDVPVLWGTILRIGPAILALATVAAVSREKVAVGQIFATRGRGIRLTVAAFCGAFLGLLLMSIGVKYAKAGIAAALSSTYPIWIIPFARVYLKETANWQSNLCTVVAVAGIGLMMM